MSRSADFLLELIFPNTCPFCGCFIRWNEYCCAECAGSLERTDFCIRCGSAKCCCETSEIDFDACAAARPYVGKVRRGILELKYHNGFNAAKYLVPEAVKKLDSAGLVTRGCVVTAVPMTEKRRRTTGYNQAEVIARLLAKQTGLKTDFGLLKKLADSPAQHELSAVERAEAASKAYFKGRDSLGIAGKTVILCDDIITTGSTLNSCSKVLREMGAEKVVCAVLASTVIEKEE